MAAAAGEEVAVEADLLAQTVYPAGICRRSIDPGDLELASVATEATS
jgi:hypothetical protein